MFPATIFFDLGDTLAFRDPAGVLRRATDARDALQVLRDRGYRIGLLSNQAATATVAAVVAELAGIGLGADLVEPALVTISSEIPGNVGKPARPVFDLALSKARHTAPSTQAIFVTEDAGHCAAATSFGWRAIQVGSGVSLGGLLALLPPAAPAASLVGTNFDLAPRPKLVGGSWAVPIDISRITGQLRFDGAASAATGDATLEFRLGKHSGCPVFDLRQPVTGVWLDGTPLLPSAVAHRDADGGPDAKVRVLDQMLDAGSTHTLRLTYDIGPPDAPMTGSYLPQVAWSAGPRLTFNFGFTDLGPGRYLESFLPANLIFDQYTVDLDVQITGTAVPHLPITNGALTTLGANHWRVVFGPRTTALSTLFELRAANTLTAATHAASLPVSGGSVAVTAWKLQTNGADVAAQAASIGGMLAANETAIGRYQHGDRFTAFINTGGMEYDGGTTSGVGPLRHEVFHSWWGRGLRPANQVDGWLDEAWTSYQDGGGTALTPLDFTEAPVTLASRNAWSRITPAAAYTSGERLFRGLAALLGAASLRSAMNAFWQKHLDRPVTTEMLETFLLARTGRPEIVEAFHRFVYGFADPSPVPDLWLSDVVRPLLG